jgi:hypothetical protein
MLCSLYLIVPNCGNVTGNHIGIHGIFLSSCNYIDESSGIGTIEQGHQDESLLNRECDEGGFFVPIDARGILPTTGSQCLNVKI